MGADDDDDEERSVSVRDMQMDWFEPAQLRCRPHTLLRVVGLTPLDGRRSRLPAAASRNCNALQTLHNQLKSTCEGRAFCVIDFAAIKAIRSACRRVKYITIDVYCQPGTELSSQQLTLCLTYRPASVTVKRNGLHGACRAPLTFLSV